MEPFKTLISNAAPFQHLGINTDVIFPGRFLRTIKRTGLEDMLFANLSFDEHGNKNADFILHQEPYASAQILLTGEDFGGGSSREHAVWALKDFGFRCLIGPSFGDIFYNNCFKSGILPIKLNVNICSELAGIVKLKNDAQFKVSLEEQVIEINDKCIPFDVDQFRKYCLLNGLDDIGLTLQKTEHIDAYEKRRTAEKPWL